jgi:hypothetical protein
MEKFKRQNRLKFAKFYETGMFVDLKIFCNDGNDEGGKESKFVNVHKVIQ